MRILSIMHPSNPPSLSFFSLIHDNSDYLTRNINSYRCGELLLNVCISGGLFYKQIKCQMAMKIVPQLGKIFIQSHP